MEFVCRDHREPISSPAKRAKHRKCNIVPTRNKFYSDDAKGEDKMSTDVGVVNNGTCVVQKVVSNNSSTLLGKQAQFVKNSRFGFTRNHFLH